MSVTQSSQSLCELLEVMRSSEFESTEAAFDKLASLCGPDIKIRYEIVKSDTVSETREAASDVERNRFSHLNKVEVRRVLLAASKARADFSRKLARECNGVVLEYPSWRVLALPAEVLSFKYSNEVAQHMDEYEIYPVNDGTVVTLYYYDGAWRLSSSNGFDVSRFKWMGTTDYMSAFLHCAKLYRDFNPYFLNEGRSYTIGFRFHEFHPLKNDPEKMWFVTAANLETLERVDEDIGIPVPAPVKFEDTGIVLLNKLKADNSRALRDYMNSVSAGKARGYDIRYGWILRSATQPNVLLESSLLREVRMNVYNVPKSRYTNAPIVDETNRMEYMALRAYLQMAHCNFNFMTLFPQFKYLQKKYDVVFDKIVRRTTDALRNRSVRERVMSSLKNGANGQDARTDRLVAHFVRHIEEYAPVNAADSVGPAIIRDFIVDRNYIDLFHKFILTDA